MGTLKKIFSLLGPEEKKKAIILNVLIVIMAFLDMLGVASIMPFMSTLADPEIIHTNKYLSFFYDYLSFQSNDDFLLFMGLSLFSLLIISMLVKTTTTYVQIRFTTMSEYTLGRRLVIGYLNQPYEWFLNQHSSDLGKTILSEVQQAINNTITPLMACIAQGMVIFAILGLLIVVDPTLAITAGCVLGGAYGLIYAALRRFLGRIGAERIIANKERFQAVSEAFGGFKDIKIAGREATFIQRFSEPAKQFSRYQSLSRACSQLPRFTLEAIAFGGMILLVLFMMKQGSDFKSTLPILTLYAFAGYRLMPAVQNFYQNLSTLRFGSGALDSLCNGLATLSTTEKNFTQPAPMGVKHQIHLKNIRYQYPQISRQALANLDLKIDARTTVALVGSTGSGKTTTVDVLLGLLRPQAGDLVVDDIVINQHNLREWQKTIGYVPQSIYLSDTDIASNIAFGIAAREIDTKAVEKAAKIANLHEFVTTELPDGYQTQIGERGLRLSGGQKQRIGIARALYHSPQVLVLDEATSALDNVTEKAVMDAVNNLGHEITIIMIAHRLSTVKNCDTIYMLESGKIVADGTYDDLLEKSEKFRLMTKNS